MEANKRVTAAIAAVMSYIQAEEAAMAEKPQIPDATSAWMGAFKPWGISGRQAQMQLRHLMQLRTFQRRG
jgi:hypothetical protein